LKRIAPTKSETVTEELETTWPIETIIPSLSSKITTTPVSTPKHQVNVFAAPLLAKLTMLSHLHLFTQWLTWAL
jgi:hypothetical protein